MAQMGSGLSTGLLAVLFITLACLYLPSETALAQEQQANVVSEAVIKGRVTDTNGSMVSGVTIVLKNLSTGLERIASTNRDGRFNFGQLHEGHYGLSVSANGFERVDKEIDASTSGEIALTLEPASIIAETTVYLGSRQEELRESLNTKVDVIGCEQMRDAGYHTVGEILRETHGVLTRRGSETTGAENFTR